MSAEPGSVFGDLLRRYRVAADLTQEMLAERAQLSARAVSDLERGVRRAPYRETVRLLAEALELPAADRAALTAAARRSGKPATRALPDAPPPTSLPTPLTSFVGRERELADTIRLLGTSRLLTLAGPGGCGKTRLAIEAARQVAGAYADGVWLVDLGPLSEADLVPAAVEATVGVREAPGRSPVEALLDFLARRSVLLVLDNCEHLVAACARLVERLSLGCPRLTVLATSREALGIAGETVCRVPPLAVPEAVGAGASDPERLRRCDSVRLFIERARTASPTFAAADHHLPVIGRICRALDGIPLAIELAAARVRVLSVERIAERLSDRFHLLTGGSRTAADRQRTLRGTVDWSHDLLSTPERTLFRRLAVFAGGWTLEAAETVCSGGAIDTRAVLDLLTQLVDKSLVAVEGEGRYRLLETLREYAAEELAAADEAGTLRRRHLDWYLALAELAMAQSMGPQQAWWLEWLAAEHDNLCAALDGAITASEEEEALRLCVPLFRFWEIRGHLAESERWLNRALAVRAGARADLRAEALRMAAWAAARRGDHVRAGGLLDDALDQFRAAADVRGIAGTLMSMGVIAAQEMRHAQAIALLEQTLALWTELDDASGIANAQLNLGLALAGAGDAERAARALDESLARFRRSGNRRGVANALDNLAGLAASGGDDERARAQYREALRLFHDLGDPAGTARCLEGLAAVHVRRGGVAHAARLLGTAEAMRESAGNPISPEARQHFEQAVASVRTAPMGADVEAAWLDGRRMDPAQLVATEIGEHETD
jgi:predicted ATPase/DNA-binding XRE family transcriptional regulator